MAAGLGDDHRGRRRTRAGRRRDSGLGTRGSKIRCLVEGSRRRAAHVRRENQNLRIPDPGSRIPNRERAEAREPPLPELSGHAPVNAQRRPAGTTLCRGLQHAVRDQPARAAPLVRDASARTRRGSQGDSGAPGACASEHHAAVHARERGAAARDVPEGASEGVTRCAGDDVPASSFQLPVSSWTPQPRTLEPSRMLKNAS